MAKPTKWKDAIVNIKRTSLGGVTIKTAISLHQSGQINKAKQQYLKILSNEPNHVEALHLLGVITFQQGDTTRAIELIHRSITLMPNYTAAQNNLGIAFRSHGRLEDAMNAFENTIKLDPNHSNAHNNLGVVLMGQGKLKESMDNFRNALKINDDCMTHQNLIYCMNYDSHISQKEIFEESKCWSDIYSKSTNKYTSYIKNESNKLRIGYVSPNFREHSVSYFFNTPITFYNQDLFEVYCYAEVDRPDEKTDRFKELSDGWCSTIGMTDSEIAERIHEDGIDILVDLAGHTADNRLLVFAEKPAPIQVAWMGYLNTTGLAEIDYRFTDEIADPTGEDDSLQSEKLIRLEDRHFCYTPSPDAPEVGELPVLTNDYITFGSFNDLMKITPEVVDTWARILQNVQNSRLIIKSKALADQKTQDRYLDMFKEHGIESDRIELCSWVESKAGHFELYNKVDIGLDTFPYNGVTTTCEAMWMGVPVIAVRGNRHCDRIAVSMLTAFNLMDLVSESIDDYIDKSITLANDLTRLSELRNDLRTIMQNSPMFDSEGFMKEIESAYQEMWRKRNNNEEE